MKAKAKGEVVSSSKGDHLVFRFDNGSIMSDFNNGLAELGFKADDEVVIICKEDLEQLTDLVRKLNDLRLAPEKHPNKTRERF